MVSPVSPPFGILAIDLTQLGLGNTDWNPITKEEAFSGDQWAAYAAEKKFADQAALEFADTHPEIDLTLRK